jgi:hypothetical protein
MPDRDREVRERKAVQAIGIVEDLASDPRVELPAALPVGRTTSNDESDPLGEPLGIKEVARLIGCSAWTVRQRCLRQGLPHFRVSRTGKLVFYRALVVRWLVEKQTERKG